MNNGIKCPYCACKMSTVRNTLQLHKQNKVRRYRVCRNCGLSYTTLEVVVEEPLPTPPKDVPQGQPKNPYL